MDNKKIYIIKASIVAILYLLVVAVWLPIKAHRGNPLRLEDEYPKQLFWSDNLFAASFIIVHALLAGTIIGAVDLIPNRPVSWTHDALFALIETGQKLTILANCFMMYGLDKIEDKDNNFFWVCVLGLFILIGFAISISLYGLYYSPKFWRDDHYCETHIAHVITTMMSVAMGVTFIIWHPYLYLKWIGPLMIVHASILMVEYLGIHFFPR